MRRNHILLALGAILGLFTSCEGAPGTNRSGDYPPVSLTTDRCVLGTSFTAKIVYKSRWIESPQYGCLAKLPPGLRFDEDRGEIRGAPTEAGVWEVFVGVRDHFKGLHETPVEQDPATLMTEHPKFIPVKLDPGQAAFYAGRFILMVTDHQVKPGQRPFEDEAKNNRWEELRKEGPWEFSRPMIGRIHYRPVDYEDPVAKYSVPEYGIHVTLPQDYAWRTEGFKFNWGLITLAEWMSADHHVGGVLAHETVGMSADRYADAVESNIRKLPSVRNFSRSSEKFLDGKGPGSWLLREYTHEEEGQRYHRASLFINLGKHDFHVCFFTREERWDGLSKKILDAIGSIDLQGPPPPAFTGIFSLQALIDFDSLDGAAVDPKTGTVSLFGHRSRTDRRVLIAYLDHLATAMECESPTFDLRWAPGSEAEVEDALGISEDKLIDRLGGLFDGTGHLTPLGAWWYGKGGAQATVGMTRYQANAAALRASGRKDEATALLTLEKREAAMNSGKADEDQAYFELFCKLLGIDGAIAAEAQKYRAGQISEEQLLDTTLPIYLGAVARLFGQDASTYKDQYFSHRRGGLGPVPASERTAAVILSPENQKAWLEQVFFRDLFKNLGDVHVPPEFCSRILSVAPRVTPTFEHLPPRSLLARVAYEADLFGKRLMVMPELKKEIPKYRTYFEWRRTISQAPKNKEGHLWFSPDGFEIKESTDGNTVTFGRTAVRINLRRKESGRSIEDPVLRQYADELSGLYDDFARLNPSLYELRECMKVVAIASWLKKKGVGLKFPAEGRCYWNPPKEAPGIVEIVFSTRGGPVGLMLWALGGVDFDGRYAHGGNPGWTFEKSAASPVVLPPGATTSSLIARDDRQIREIMKKTSQIEVPPPGTPVFGEAGWCRRSDVGAQDRAHVLSYLTLRQEGLVRNADYPKIEAQRDRVLLLAKKIEHCDQMTNARTKKRVDEMAELEDLKKAALKTRDELIDDLCWAGHDAVLEWDNDRIDHWGGATGAEWRKSKLVDFRKDLASVRGLLQETLDGLEEIREHKADNVKILKIMEKVGELAKELNKFMPEVEALEKVAEAAETTLPIIRISVTAVGVWNKAAELWDLNLRGKEINDRLGEAAKDEKAADKDCKQHVDDFVREFRKLKEMVEGQPKPPTAGSGENTAPKK